MNVLMISPGYPGEMPYFTRGLASRGARVFGLGDQPMASLDARVRQVLVAHVQVSDLWNEAAVIDRVRREADRAGVRFDRIESLWEPAMVLAARLREALGVPGMGVDQTRLFRDKELMKQALDAAGIRTPWHKRARTVEEVRAAAKDVGFPLIVKPIDGAGSCDTYRLYNANELESILPALRGVAEVSVEEYVEGEEFTFDTVCADGEILYENIAYYMTRPIEEKKHEWISPGCICLRDLDDPKVRAGREMGHRVLRALGFRDGFSHMEWYLKADGEVVFGEIGARPPGAHMVEAMCYASDVDLYGGWADAVVHGHWSQGLERKYNSAIVCKRAVGRGRIQRIEGLDRLQAELGPHIAKIDILPPGAMRRDWQNAAVSDGFVIVRHPDFATTLRMAGMVAQGLQIYAG